MAGALLTTAATMACPHGGTITAAPAQTRLSCTAVALTAADTFTIAGCPFQIPAVPPIPSPCVSVLWILPETRLSAGAPLLSVGSAGLCLSAAGVPQGAPVLGPGQTRAVAA